MGLKREGTKAFVWDFAGKLANQGIGFVVSVFLARLLMPEDFGTIAMIMVVIGLASIFVDVGLSGALIQHKRLLNVHYNSVFYFNSSIGLLLSLLLFLAAPLLERFYVLLGIAVYSQALSPLFFLNSLCSVQSMRLRRVLKFDVLARVQLIAAFISGAIGVVMAFMGYGIWSLVWQQLMQALLSLLLLWSAEGWRPGFQFSFKALKQLWGFGFNMFLSSLLDRFVTQFDIILIGRVFSASALGFYQRARSLDTMVTRYTSSSLMSVVYPVLSRLQHQQEKFREVIEKVLHLISFAAFGLVGLFFLSGEELILLLFGEQWQPSVVYFKIMILASYAYPVNSVLVNVLKGKGNSRAFLRVEIIKKSIFLLNLGIGLSFGIQYFLYGYILTSFISTQLNIHFAKKEISRGAWWFSKIIYGYGLVAIVAAGAVMAFSDLLMQNSALLLIGVKSLLFVLLYIGFTTTSGFKANKDILSELNNYRLIKQNA